MEQRLTDANALIEATKNFCDGYEVHWTDNKVLAWIDHAPTVDAVPVVRCGECLFKRPRKEYGELHCRILDAPMNNNDFCSYGERRSDG